MPDGDRLTLCVSTQVGCAFACAFCYTGTMGLERNLGAGEIVGQVIGAARMLGPGRRLTHVVYMGMGEPLANYQATVQSLRILTDSAGFAMAPRRITVSTVGLVGGIERLAKENLRVNLAISLHATDNDIRDRIMPVNKGFAIEELLAACKRFPLPFRQRMTFEYVLLEGINDAPDDARRLVRLLKGIRGKVNLIPFNDWEGSRFAPTAIAAHRGLPEFLLQHGITATVRWSKGEDIGAACGQLREAVPGVTAPGTVAVSTLGCRLNQVESQEILALFAGRGSGRPRPMSAPQIHVVNTCTVTGRADFSDRQTIRRIARDNPAGAPRRNGMLCADRRRGSGADSRGGLGRGQPGEVSPARPPRRSRKRPQPEIQVGRPAGARGARRRAARPRVGPLARLRQDPGWLPAPLRVLHRAGGPRRKPQSGADVVLDQVETLVDSGYGEITLTGVDIGHYGRDLVRARASGPLLHAWARCRACAGSACPRYCPPTGPMS